MSHSFPEPADNFPSASFHPSFAKQQWGEVHKTLVCSRFNEADKCPLPIGAILEVCRQAKRCGERARHKTGGGGSRHMLPDDLG